MTNHTNIYRVSMKRCSRKLYTKLTGRKDFDRILRTPYDYQLGEVITPVEFEIQDPNDQYVVRRFYFTVESLITVIPE